MARNTDAETIAQAFYTQAAACGQLGSPFMEWLLTRAAEELDRTGSDAGVLSYRDGDPATDAVPLRLAAALHALALSGQSAELKASYRLIGDAQLDDAFWR